MVCGGCTCHISINGTRCSHYILNYMDHSYPVVPQQHKLGVFSHSKIKVPEQVGAARSARRKVGNRVPGKGFLFQENPSEQPNPHSARLGIGFPGRDSQARFPGAGSQVRFPRGSQEQVQQGFPARGSQARFPGTGSQARFPGRGSQQGSQARLPGTDSQARVPRKRLPRGMFSGRGSQARFPRGSNQGSQEQVPKQGFPGKGSQQEVPKHLWVMKAGESPSLPHVQMMFHVFP